MEFTTLKDCKGFCMVKALYDSMGPEASLQSQTTGSSSSSLFTKENDKKAVHGCQCKHSLLKLKKDLCKSKESFDIEP